MSDVAREAGVSKMTVSNVINGRPGASEETRSRVMAAVQRLDYRLNAAARHFRAGRSGAIGLLVPHLDGPYYSHLAVRLDTMARARGYHVIVERTGASREGELLAIASDRVRPYDGIVFSPVQLDTSDVLAAGIGVPVVLLGERRLAGPFDHVMMDNVGGAELAVTHLIQGGARRIALVGGRPDRGVDSMATLRTRGYHQAHARAGLAVDDRLVIDAAPFTTADGYEAVMRLHGQGVPFDGVLVLTDAAAMGVLRALADLGRRVPDEVQVVGFDNDVEGEYLVPRLTTIDPGNESMAAHIMERLLGRIEDAVSGEDAVEVVTTARLVVRESTRRVDHA
ncbi:LacI family DNA-binding transcriptional regulator [Isoptericola halotolerans]|uniref:DNA-binding LacI/PurR family transcriptional regulator n=1 Tax=Isoptericola halotolerans TaxID=300560 RepID=A0ABX2A886_9MICO|nr:LacI family DNA-binding transcriptional regulator [Isoptericola halotolerans]NOV98120.1 DNA-binding LacI/PurR family transcriptional regulator [Isoptericola halotolerans]